MTAGNQNEIEGKEVYEISVDPTFGDDKGSQGYIYSSEDDYEVSKAREILDADGIVRNAIDTTDDINQNPWTFRSVFLGVGLAIFGSVLGEIYYFKPQTIVVNGIFLVMIAFVIAEAMSKFIPRKSGIRWLDPILWFFNPHPFNIKEHTLIAIIATTASTAALGTEVLAVQKLWYNSSVNQGAGIFIIFSSQILGYGIVGLVRKVLVYPTKMFYPNILPQVAVLQTLHKDKSQNHKRLKIFYICFAALFLWEILPEWIFPLLIGFSIPCLAAPNSSVVSYLFGGTNGNEGLGFLSFCFDWQYIASTGNPMAVPIQATMNNIFGYFLCIICFMGVYYGNLWDAKKFPFLSQELFNSDSNGTYFDIFNQTLILDSQNVLNVTALEEIGVPYMTPTYTLYLIATNLSIAATFTYMALWHWDIVETTFYWLSPSEIKNWINPRNWDYRFWNQSIDHRLEPDGTVHPQNDDPHFRAILNYKEVPMWWYVGVLLLSAMVALICMYKSDSGLPWWAFIIAVILAIVFTASLGGLVAMFGFGGTQMQTVIQMIGSYLRPGNPMCNMYFTLYGYNSVQQAFVMLQDLKQAQYIKLSPRSTFAGQLIGTVIGSIFNYVMMSEIVTNQRKILLSIEGTDIWSGQNVQQYNTQGVSWGALAKYMYSVGARYEWVPLSLLLGFVLPVPFYLAHRLFPKVGFNTVNIPILVWYIGWLCVGVNSSITSYFIIAIVSQWYLRVYHPKIFKDYNYVVAAGLTGGTQVMVFILSFAVQGASGKAVVFPEWWGNNVGGNMDHCFVNE